MQTNSNLKMNIAAIMTKKNKNVSESQIRDCEITYEGTKYAPVKHGIVIDLIKEHLANNGFVIEKEEYLSSKSGQQVIGKYYLAHTDSEIKPLISFKNSLDGTMSFGIAAGTSVFICGNGIVFGDTHMFKRKHSGDAEQDIRDNIEMACRSLPTMLQFHKQFVEDLKSVPILRKQMYEILGTLFFTDVLNSEELNTVYKEFKLPTHDYGYPDTAWELYNYCTFALKEAHPIRWHKNHKALSDFFVTLTLTANGYYDEEE